MYALLTQVAKSEAAACVKQSLLHCGDVLCCDFLHARV